jgi:hypothetical protein
MGGLSAASAAAGYHLITGGSGRAREAEALRWPWTGALQPRARAVWRARIVALHQS